jgi:hypothetical protein
MEIVYFLRIDQGQGLGEKRGLFLIVAFNANPVERFNDGLKKPDSILLLNNLSEGFRVSLALL